MLDCQLSIDSVYEEKDPKFIFINCCRFSFIQKIRIHKNDRFESDFDFHERKTHSFCFCEVNCEIVNHMERVNLIKYKSERWWNKWNMFLIRNLIFGNAPGVLYHLCFSGPGFMNGFINFKTISKIHSLAVYASSTASFLCWPVTTSNLACKDNCPISLRPRSGPRQVQWHKWSYINFSLDQQINKWSGFRIM